MGKAGRDCGGGSSHEFATPSLSPDSGGALYFVAMVKVELTRHLYNFFPKLEGEEIHVEASTVAEVVRQVDAIAPGFAFYVCDERGRLRTHVNIFIEEELIADRARLSDPVKPDSRVFILQALSGG
jgi:molybdopterin synthase sulfur carrier subunit